MASRRSRSRNSKRSGRKNRAARSTGGSFAEEDLVWIGGRGELPAPIAEGGKLLHYDWLIWLEQPSGLIVGQALVPHDEAPDALAALLLDTMETPFVGPARTPARIRVATTLVADAVEARVSASCTVEVAPVPEVDELAQSLIENLVHQSQERGYLEGDGVDTPTLEPFFTSAARFAASRCWEIFELEDEIGVDIPELGIEGAIAKVAGPSTGAVAILLFPNIERYADHMLASDDELELAALFSETGEEPCRAVHFIARDDLPERMQEEIAAHGWPITADLCPVVTRFEAMDIHTLPNRYDYRLTGAVLSALADFAEAAVEAHDPEPVAPQVLDPAGLRVEISLLDDADTEEADVVVALPPAAPPGVRLGVRLGEKEYQAVRDLDVLSRRGRAVLDRATPAPEGEGWLLDAPPGDLEYLSEFVAYVAQRGSRDATSLAAAATAMQRGSSDEIELDWSLVSEDGGVEFKLRSGYGRLIEAADRLRNSGQRNERRRAQRGNDAKRTIYQLKVTLKGIRPPIWRRIEVCSDIRLARLHSAIQKAMGWTDSHLHEFVWKGERFGVPDAEMGDVENERKIWLDQLLQGPKDRLEYLYDFGDSWEHTVVLEKVLPLPKGKKQPRPRCTGGRRACPPEDCGGPWGYASMLQALADPRHPEHAEYRDWLGREFDPEAFEPDR